MRVVWSGLLHHGWLPVGRRVGAGLGIGAGNQAWGGANGGVERHLTSAGWLATVGMPADEGDGGRPVGSW
jgi:hypothetical protein